MHATGSGSSAPGPSQRWKASSRPATSASASPGPGGRMVTRPSVVGWRVGPVMVAPEILRFGGPVLELSLLVDRDVAPGPHHPSVVEPAQQDSRACPACRDEEK